MRILSLFLGGGGLAAAIAAIVAYRRAAATEQQVVEAVAGAGPEVRAKVEAAKTPAAVVVAVESAAPPAPVAVLDAAKRGDVAAVKASSWYTGRIKLRLTTYYPFTARESEKQMEGGVHDRVGKSLHTLEDFLAGKSDHVSLSGDDLAWPYGQKVTFDLNGRQVVGRVTDTGRNFRGSTKVYRAKGEEPIDVCVYAKATKVPEHVEGTIEKGNVLQTSGKSVKAVAVAKFKGQEVQVGREGRFDLIGALSMEEAIGRVPVEHLNAINSPEAMAARAAARETARGRVVSSNGRERRGDQAAGSYAARENDWDDRVRRINEACDETDRLFYQTMGV